MIEINVIPSTPVPPGWRFQAGDYGNLHGWFETSTQRGAFVAGGKDSFDRAAKLIRGEWSPAAWKQLRNSVILYDEAAVLGHFGLRLGPAPLGIH